MSTTSRTIVWASIALLLSLRIASAQNHEITLFRYNHAGAVTIGFDDGRLTQYEVAVPLLNAKGVKGTFFITTVDMPVSWDQWRQVAAQGHEIASHTVTHADLTTLSDAELRYELSESQRAINENIPSQRCISLAYPLNENNAYVRAVTSEYYVSARAGWVDADGGGDMNFYQDMDPTLEPPPGINMSLGSLKAVNFYEVSGDSGPFFDTLANIEGKLDFAVTYHAWHDMYIHDINDDHINYLNTLLDDILARDLWVAPYGEVALYMRERLASTLSVLSSDSSVIQLDLTNPLDASIYNEPLTIRSVVPSTWQKVQIARGGSSIWVDSAVEGTDTVVYFDVVPNLGTITLSSEPQTLTTIGVSPSSASVGAGSMQQFTATAKDQYGNALVAQPSFTWAVTGGGTISSSGLFTADTEGGPYTVTASSGAISGTAIVTVVPPPTLTSISVAPSAASVGVGGTQQFAATAKDQYGNAMVPQPSFSWTVSGGGTIDSSGLFTAASTAGGPFTVTASSGGNSGMASVTVVQTLTGISVAPTSASVGVGGTQQFTATANDQYGNAMVPQPSLNWAVSGGGTIDSSGLFTAAGTAGGPFTVTASSGGISGMASVTVIQAPSITVTAPNTKVSWRVGDTKNITFTHNIGVGQTVNIDVSRDGGATWGLVTTFTTTAKTSGKYAWIVSGPPTTQARIKVSWTVNPSVTDSSDVNFTILPRVTVTAPNTAVTWGAGSTRDITWTHNLGVGGMVNIEFSPDNGVSWTMLAAGVACTAATTGMYTGPMPTTVTTQGLVRVSPTSDPSLGDVSNVSFTLAAPSITVTAPNTATTLGVGTTYTIKWKHNLGTKESVLIQLARDGINYTDTLTGSVSNSANTAGTYSWGVAGPTTATARVRVTWTKDATVSDISNVNFRIQ